MLTLASSLLFVHIFEFNCPNFHCRRMWRWHVVLLLLVEWRVSKPLALLCDREVHLCHVGELVIWIRRHKEWGRNAILRSMSWWSVVGVDASWVVIDAGGTLQLQLMLLLCCPLVGRWPEDDLHLLSFLLCVRSVVLVILRLILFAVLLELARLMLRIILLGLLMLVISVSSAVGVILIIRMHLLGRLLHMWVHAHALALSRRLYPIVVWVLHEWLLLVLPGCIDVTIGMEYLWRRRHRRIIAILSLMCVHILVKTLLSMSVSLRSVPLCFLSFSGREETLHLFVGVAVVFVRSCSFHCFCV